MNHSVIRLGTRLFRATVAGAAMLIPASIKAQIFNGGGLNAGLGHAANIAGLASGTDPRTTITNIIVRIVQFTALLGVVAIVVAGLYLILGFGSDDSRDKAKKIILYTLIGLAIILFARVIIGFVTIVLRNYV